MKGQTFKVGAGVIPNIGKKIERRTAQMDRAVQQRVIRATNLIWGIAHQKRPMITKAEMVNQGRSRRVSDPNAQAGVPVNTGALQASIQQKVSRAGFMSYLGRIWTKSPYAGYMEYGTRKILARPFMRPAINLTKDAIKNLFRVKVDSNL